MRCMSKARAKIAMAAVAAQKGVSMIEMKQVLQETIDVAWSNPEAEEVHKQLFPAGKPTPAQFITVISAMVKEKERSS